MVKSVTSVKDLEHNPNNPRDVTEDKLRQLEKAFHEFGDLGCIVYNRTTKRLVTGHQRSKIIPHDAEIEIVERYKKPTRTGTIAEGFITIDAEKYKYREVVWDETRESTANIAANRSAGTFNRDKLRDNLHHIDESGIDLELAMFDRKEREKLFKSFEDKGKKAKNDSRVSSSEVKTVSLTFAADKLQRFNENINFFQRYLQIDNVTDTVSAVLETAREMLDENSPAAEAKDWENE